MWVKASYKNKCEGNIKCQHFFPGDLERIKFAKSKMISISKQKY